MFDFSSARLVLAGTLYGEARSCGQPGMEDVAQCVLNRLAGAWQDSVAAVCLAPKQFSCWNVSDPNRTEILAAAAASTPLWQTALAIADRAIADENPDRLLGADSYYARSMSRPPYWAKLPGTWRFSDACHNFWRLHPVMNAPVVSVHSGLTADDLNQLQLELDPGAPS